MLLKSVFPIYKYMYPSEKTLSSDKCGPLNRAALRQLPRGLDVPLCVRVCLAYAGNGFWNWNEAVTRSIDAFHNDIGIVRNYCGWK